MDKIRFLTTGYEAKRKDAMSITVLTDEKLWIARVTGKMRGITRQIAECDSLTTALGHIPPRRRTEISIPLDCIRSMSWMEHETAFRVTFDDDRRRTRTRTMHIQTLADRLKLVELLEQTFGHQFQRRERPIGFWKAARHELIGALIAAVLAVSVQLAWDPQAFARIRNGWILLLLGKKGCALVGLVCFVGCLMSAWGRLNSRPIEYHCAV